MEDDKDPALYLAVVLSLVTELEQTMSAHGAAMPIATLANLAIRLDKLSIEIQHMADRA
jgi:hypothetical protein